MSVQFTPTFVVTVALVALVAGSVNGLAGFGFALVGTMVLATVIDPATAVVFMIVPILAVNLSLLSDLSASELRTCGRRFGPSSPRRSWGRSSGWWSSTGSPTRPSAWASVS